MLKKSTHTMRYVLTTTETQGQDQIKEKAKTKYCEGLKKKMATCCGGLSGDFGRRRI